MPQTERIGIYCTAEILREAKRAAEAAELPLGTWIRLLIVKELEKLREKKARKE